MSNVKAAAPPTDAAAQILTDEAIAFVGELQERFGARRAELLAARSSKINFSFLVHTRGIFLHSPVQ